MIGRVVSSDWRRRCFLLFALALLGPRLGSAALPVAFQFTLSHEQRTSAGVFQPDGTLVRTIWSGVTYPAGTNTGTWDGLDDWGNLVPDGPYQVRVLANRCTYTWEGVVGNTSSQWTGSTVWNGYETIGGIAIAGSKAYYANGYPEGGSTTGTFSTDNPNGTRKRLFTKNGATAWLVATDGILTYWAGRDRGAAAKHRFVFAVRVSDDEEVDFPAGERYTIVNGPTYRSVIEKRTDGSEASGLAVQRKGSFLFVAHADKNEIAVLHKTTGTAVRTVTGVPAPGAMAIDGNDNLWAVHKTGATFGVARYEVSGDGALKRLQALAATFENPMALAVSPDGATLVVADGGGSQQLKAFSTSTGQPLWTLGQRGGYATTTAVTDDRFMFGEHAAISFQPDGTFWACDFGNGRVQHYSASRDFIERIQFRKSSFFCSVDPNDPTRLFSDYLEYSINYSLPLDPANGSWKLVRNWEQLIPAGYGGNYQKLYPCTLNNGRTYALLPKPSAPGQKAGAMEMFELTADGRLRVTGVVIPTTAATLHADGSIRMVSQPAPLKDAAAASMVTWTTAALTGFDKSANPIYAAPVTTASAPCTGTDPVWWYGSNKLRAGVETTGGIIVSFDPGLPDDERRRSTGYHLGGVRAGDTKWLWRTSMSTHGNYFGDWPADGAFDIGNRVQYAGSVALAVDRHIFYGYHGEFYKNSQANKFRHYYENGLYIGEFGELGANVGYSGMLAPAKMAGNVQQPWIVKLPDGRVYLYHNDEGWHGGVHRWRIDGLDTVTEFVTNLEWKAPVVAGLRAEYFDTADLNNAYLKTARADHAVNFSWGAAIPTDTALTATKGYSVRWTGFVAPRHSETYTFHTMADGGVQLWINDQLIIDADVKSSGQQSGAITLEAGIRYAVKLEYRQSGATGKASLSWSSNRQPKQIVPPSALCWAPWLHTAASDGKLDLLAGQPLNVSVSDGLYGMKRVPAADAPESTDRWIVRTSKHTYRSALNGKNDLSCFFRKKDAGKCFFVRDLGAASNATRWKLETEINYEGNYFNDDDVGGQFLEVLDDRERIIARVYPRVVTFETDYRLTANTADLWQGVSPKTKSDGAMDTWQSLTISAAEGRITFKFGANPAVVTDALDPLANWQRPKRLRFYFWSDGGHRSDHARLVAVRGLTFAKHPSEPVSMPPVELPPPVELTMTVQRPVVPTPVTAELAALQEQFRKDVAARVTAPYEMELQRLNADYAAGLDRLIVVWRNMGKAIGAKEVIAVLEAEKQLLDARQPLPATDDASTPPVLKSGRAAYRSAHAKLVATRTANLKRLTGPLGMRLMRMESDFAKADRPLDAAAVREYRESLAKVR